jgi:hypothetical protein
MELLSSILSAKRMKVAEEVKVKEVKEKFHIRNSFDTTTQHASASN